MNAVSPVLASLALLATAGCYTPLTSPAQDRTYREIVGRIVNEHPVALPSGALVMTAAYYQERRAEHAESADPVVIPHMLITLKFPREDKESTLRVRDDGMLSFDLMERPIKAAGLTFAELEKALEQALSYYYRAPRILVERPLEAERGETGENVYVINYAGNGGKFALTGDAEADTLRNFLAAHDLVGGEREDWNEISVRRKRRIEELDQTITYVILCDLESNLYEVDERQNIPLYGNDFIYIHLKENPILLELLALTNLFGGEFLFNAVRSDQQISYLLQKLR